MSRAAVPTQSTAGIRTEAASTFLMGTSVDARARVVELPCESGFLCPVGTGDDDAAGCH